jgi:predicted hydrocarbon binding protein
MRELIYRDDCDLNAPSLGRDEMLWDLIYEMGMPDSEEMFNFAKAVMDRAQAVIDTAPTITTDEVMAYKCPECKVISILYDPENELWCPNCGIRRH